MNRKAQRQTREQKIALNKKAGVVFDKSKANSKYARKYALAKKGIYSPQSPFGKKLTNNSLTNKEGVKND